MPRSTSRPELSPKVLEELQTQLSRISGPQSALRMWERLLADAERKRLGGDLQTAYYRWKGAVGMWMRVRHVSQIRAIVEVARGLGFLLEANATWLLRESGEQCSTAPQTNQPEWNPDTGTLQMGGKTIRKIRMMAKPSNIQRILDAFDEQGWPSTIDNPLPGPADQQKLHETLRSLNEGLKKIKFHAWEGAQTIAWEAK